MDELRVRHLGAPRKPHDGSGPLERPRCRLPVAEQERVDSR